MDVPAERRSAFDWAPGSRLILARGSELLEEQVPGQLQTRAQREMAQEAHLIFIDTSLSPLEKSVKYRACIQTARRKLERALDEEPEGNGVAHILERQTFAHAVWEFAEICYLRPGAHPVHGDTVVTPELISEWFAANFTDINNLLDRPQEDNKEWLWSTVCRLAAVGRRNDAETLLRSRVSIDLDNDEELPEEAATDPYVIAVLALEEAPVEDDGSPRDNGRWREWQEQCFASSSDYQFPDDSGVVRLLRVLAGEVEVLISSCTTWVELLVAATLYAVPTTNQTTLITSITEACQIADEAFDEPLNALTAFADGNSAEALLLLRRDLSWHAAHLSELISSTQPPLICTELSSGVELREFLMLEFARSLEQYPRLWRIAADYFLACPKQGRAHLEQMLLRLPTDCLATRMPQKVIAFALQLSFPNVVESVCNRLASKFAEQGDLPAATYWFSQAGAIEQVASIAKRALDLAQKGGPFSTEARQLNIHVDAVWASGNVQVQTDLEFIRLYDDFQLSVVAAKEDSDNVNEALSLAVLLISRTGGLPRHCWILMLLDIYEVLQVSCSFVTPGSMYSLMVGLETVVSSELLPNWKTLMMRRGYESEEECELVVSEMRFFFIRGVSMAILSRGQTGVGDGERMS